MAAQMLSDEFGGFKKALLELCSEFGKNTSSSVISVVLSNKGLEVEMLPVDEPMVKVKLECGLRNGK